MNLVGNGPGWHRLRERVSPQVAKDAPPGALTIRQKNNGDRHEFARGGAFLFDQIGIGLLGVQGIGSGAVAENPLVSPARVSWII